MTADRALLLAALGLRPATRPEFDDDADLTGPNEFAQ